MHEAELLEENLHIWSIYCPEGAKKVRTASSNHLEIEMTSSNLPTLKIKKSRPPIYFHSKIDPLQEAEEWKDSLYLSNYTLVYLYGIGLGYPYEVLRSWLKQDPKNMLVILDDDPAMLAKLFETERGTDILKDPQVWVYYYEGGRDISSQLMKLSQSHSFIPYTAIHFPKGQLRSRNYNRLTAQLAHGSAIMNSIGVEYTQVGARFFQNYYINMYNIPQAYQGEKLAGTFNNVPAIICGAGPSLGKQLPLLAQIKEHALIFAGGTALNALAAENITPHFAVGIDPNPTHLNRIIMNKTFTQPFFYRNRIYPKTLNVNVGPQLYLSGSSGYSISEWFDEKMEIDPKEFSEGFNVINFSLSIAKTLGCNPIIAIGVDLAYTDSKSYSPGIVIHPIHERSKDFTTKSETEDLLNYKDIYGKPINTLWKWIDESLWYSKIAKESKNLVFINSTEGGIGFPGVANIPFHEIVTKLKKKIDFSVWTHGEIENASFSNRISTEKIDELLNELKENCNKCIHILQEGLEKIENAIKISSEPINASVDKFLTGERFPFEDLLENEFSYEKIISHCDQHYMRLHRFEFERIDFEELLQLTQQPNLARLKINYDRTKYLLNAIKFNVHTLELVKKQHDEMINEENNNKEIASPSISSSQAELENNSNCIYRFDNNRLIILDPMLNLDIDEPFAPDSKHDVNSLYYPDKSIKMTTYLKNKEFHGPSTFYSKDGKQLAQSWHYHGKKTGKALCWYANGQLASIESYLNNMKHGQHLFFHRNGTLRAIIPYENDKLHGQTTLYFPSGKIMRIVNFNAGQFHGADFHYSKSGQLVLEGHFKHNNPKGIARLWYTNGVLSKEISYSIDHEMVSSRSWDPQGNLIQEKIQRDQYDKINDDTALLNHSIDNIIEQVGKLVPILANHPNCVANTEVQTLFNEELKNIQQKMKQLYDLQKDLVEASHTSHESKGETYWKGPAVLHEVEKMMANITGEIQKNMQKMEQIVKRLQK